MDSRLQAQPGTAGLVDWLPFSAIARRELVDKLDDPALPIWEAAAGLRDFCERLRHELATHYYVQLDTVLPLRLPDDFLGTVTAFLNATTAEGVEEAT
jgi:hypothetical protein